MKCSRRRANAVSSGASRVAAPWKWCQKIEQYGDAARQDRARLVPVVDDRSREHGRTLVTGEATVHTPVTNYLLKPMVFLQPTPSSPMAAAAISLSSGGSLR